MRLHVHVVGTGRCSETWNLGGMWMTMRQNVYVVGTEKCSETCNKSGISRPKYQSNLTCLKSFHCYPKSIQLPKKNKAYVT